MKNFKFLFLLTSFLFISCTNNQNNYYIEDCIHIITGEKIIFDSRKVTKRINGFTNNYVQFIDQNGYKRTVNTEELTQWKCKRR